MVNLFAPDFTQHPPRSPRVRLGGFVHLPRLLDKARAHAAGQLGDYVWNCPLDQRWTAFTGIDADALLAEVKLGRSDTEMLAWVMANMKPARQPWEIEAWSRWLSTLAAGNVARHTMFAESLSAIAPHREDMVTYFDRLDLDDYASYGGKA
ncbi:MAG: DUF5069 domain-containing protein [Candidatus Didemnitutus sp.]|nr:DUF5069 domain-containing protein [Candidatus Didemnitutus sp.]